MTLQRAVLADFHLPVGAVAESQAANVTQLIERLRIATPRWETEFAIGQREEGGRGARRGDGERFGSMGQAKGTVDQGSPHPHRGKEMYRKNSLPVTEHPCANPSDCQNAFHDSSPAIISQQAGSSASFPAQASLSHRLNGVRLPSQCTLNQFYDFIFMATSPCLEKEHLLTRDSVIFKVIYFMRALK